LQVGIPGEKQCYIWVHSKTWEDWSKSCNAGTEIFHCFNVANHGQEVKLQKISAGVSPSA